MMDGSAPSATSAPATFGTIASCWNFDPATTPEEGLARLADCAIEAIELWPTELRRFGVARWRAALQRSGLTCVQLCPYFDFMHGPVGVEMGRSVLAEFLAAAAELGCTRLRAFTGPPWGGHMVGAAQATREQWQATIDGLREYCLRAALQGVELCLECHHHSLIEDVPGVTRLLDGVGLPNLTVNLQLPLLATTWQDAVAGLGARTTHLHVHNWEEGFDCGELTFLGDGAVDWHAILGQVARFGRAPCVSLEHLAHGGRHDPWATVRRDGPWLRALRERLATGAG